MMNKTQEEMLSEYRKDFIRICSVISNLEISLREAKKIKASLLFNIASIETPMEGETGHPVNS